MNDKSWTSVPQGFTNFDEACTQYYATGRQIMMIYRRRFWEICRQDGELNERSLEIRKSASRFRCVPGSCFPCREMMDTILTLVLMTKSLSFGKEVRQSPLGLGLLQDALFRCFRRSYGVGKNIWRLIDELKKRKDPDDVDLTVMI